MRLWKTFLSLLFQESTHFSIDLIVFTQISSLKSEAVGKNLDFW